MPLVDLKTILRYAGDGDCAIPAFNVYNLETLLGVFAAAETCRAPVIVQLYSRVVEGETGRMLAAMAIERAQSASVPACVHLDHGSGRRAVVLALRYGLSGVMFDASHLPLEENIVLSGQIAELCREAGVPMEGEIGHIGSTRDETLPAYTDPDEAAHFVAKTGVAALAVMVGTAHGRYRRAPRIDVSRIREIARATGTPLVLHGGSGIDDEQIRAAIRAGIRKVNFGTDVCCAFLDEVMRTDRSTVAIDLFMRPAIRAVEAFAAAKIALLDAGGRHG